MKINKEDLILYGVCIAVLAFLAFYFTATQNRLEDSIFSVGASVVDGSDSIQHNPLKLKYLFAEKALLSNAARINMSFLIGSILCLLGSMIIIRRVRTEATSIEAGKGDFKFNIQSNSSGIIIASLGTIIILCSIYFKDQYKIDDGGLTFTTEEELNSAPTAQATPDQEATILED